MTVGNNPVDRRRNGIPLSTVITSASTHDIKAVTNVIDNSVSHRTSGSSFTNKNKDGLYYHIYLDRAHSSNSIENDLIKRGYVHHIPYKRKVKRRKSFRININFKI